MKDPFVRIPWLIPATYHQLIIVHIYCVGVTVDAPSVNRNNSLVDENGNSLVANANIAPAIHIISSVGVHFNGGQITHIGPRADDIAPIIKIEGIVKDIRFNGYIDTGRASVANFAGDIDLSNSPNASREVYFDGAPLVRLHLSQADGTSGVFNNIAFLLLFVIAWPKIAWVICCHITEDIFWFRTS